MLGAGGQSVHVVPSHDLVIVRIGKYRAADHGETALGQSFPLFLAAVRPH